MCPRALRQRPLQPSVPRGFSSRSVSRLSRRARWVGVPPAHAASALEGSLSRAPSPPGPCLSADHCSLRVTTSRPSSMSDPCRASLEGNVCVPEGAPTRTSSLLHTQPPPIWIQATPPPRPGVPGSCQCFWCVCGRCGGGGLASSFLSQRARHFPSWLLVCWQEGKWGSMPRAAPAAQGPEAPAAFPSRGGARALHSGDRAAAAGPL